MAIMSKPKGTHDNKIFVHTVKKKKKKKKK